MSEQEPWYDPELELLEHTINSRRIAKAVANNEAKSDSERQKAIGVLFHFHGVMDRLEQKWMLTANWD